MEYIDYSKYFSQYYPNVEEKLNNTQIDYNSGYSNPLGLSEFTEIPQFPNFETYLRDTRLKLFYDLFDKSNTSTSDSTSNETSQIGNFNVDAAVQELHKNCNYQLRSGQSRITSTNENQFSKKNPNQSGHYCGTSVRLALEAGGLGRVGANTGGSFGPILLKNGWKEVPLNNKPQKGDIAVTTPFGNHKNGHVSMYDGTLWVSDFLLRSMFVFNSAENHTTIYRYQG